MSRSSSDALLSQIGRFTTRALEAAGAEAVLADLATTLRDVLGADQVHLLEISSDAAFARALVFGRDADGAPAVDGPDYAQVLDGRPSAVESIVQHPRLVHAPVARGHPLLRPDQVARWEVESAFFLPVVVSGEVRAVVTVLSRRPRTFSEAELSAAQSFADVAGLAVARLEAEAGHTAARHQQRSILRSARAIGASLDLHEVLTTLCREAHESLRADMAGVYLGNADTGGIAVAGHGVGDHWHGRVIAPGEGVGGRVIVSGATEVVNDYRADVDVPDIPPLHEIETAVGVPISWEGQLRGALAVGFRRMRRVTPEDVAVLEAVADLASTACQNAEAYRRVRTQASTDALTGILNHGAMQGRVAEEIDRARRTGAPLSLILLDLDNFKRLNDRHGHHAGDRFLRRVASALGRASRPYDGLARYGGDEFVLLLPATPPGAAAEVAERLRTAVSAVAREDGLSGLELGSSAGLAAWREPLTSVELLERADRALRLAKRRGKERVCHAGPQTDEELALLDVRAGSPSSLVRQFWDVLAACEDAAEAVAGLPAFLRRTLDLEEAALYEVVPGTRPITLRRSSRARQAGDPGLSAFVRTELVLGDEEETRMDLGPRSRPNIAELLGAFGVEDAAATPGPTGACAGVPLLRAGTLRGLLILRCSERSFPPERLRQAELLARQATMMLAGREGDGSPAAVRALAAAIDARDDYTHEHSQDVVRLASSVARRLELGPREVEQVERAALLHDVGKVGIPNEILHKSGPLDPREWRHMREHPVIGERILRRTPELEDIAPLVRHEHERWDGCGYPDGLAGEEIPIGSRIILACDAYNAMITRRPYREPMPHVEALAELRRHAGSQFDPAVVAALEAELGARRARARPAAAPPRAIA